MRRYSPNFIDQVCRANDIVDIIGEDTFLKKTGENYMGLCPFPSHNEKTPSFSVSQRKQVYHCFGCGESGNIITYMQVKRGFRFKEALESLAQRAGLPLPQSQESHQAEDKAGEEQQQMREINRMACAFYEETLRKLPADHMVQQYLKQRGFLEKTIKTFRIGFAPKGWDLFYSYLKKQSPEGLKWALQLGLIKNKDGQYYDAFRDRIMFPVFNRSGQNVLGFGGRVVTEESKQAKYINSVDSPLFHKGQTFYGWQHTAPFIRDTNKALVVEGYTDYLSLYQNGFRNMVATLGTALTESHAKWLSYQTEHVVLFFDGDPAGEKATERSLNVLLSQGLVVKVLKLEKEQDPDSFIRKEGKKALEQKMSLAPDLFLSLFLEQLKKHPPGVDRFALIEKIAQTLAVIKKTQLKHYYTERVLDSFGVDRKTAYSILQKAQRKFLKQASSYQQAQTQNKDGNVNKETEKEQEKEEQKLKVSLKGASKAELSLLMLALNSPNYYQKLKSVKVMDKINHQGVIDMFKTIEECYKKNGFDFQLMTPILIDMLPQEEVQKLNKNRYPELLNLSLQKVDVFIQDCFQRMERDRRRWLLKNLATHIRADSSNTKKYVMEIAKQVKSSQSM